MYLSIFHYFLKYASYAPTICINKIKTQIFMDNFKTVFQSKISKFGLPVRNTFDIWHYNLTLKNKTRHYFLLSTIFCSVKNEVNGTSKLFWVFQIPNASEFYCLMLMLPSVLSINTLNLLHKFWDADGWRNKSINLTLRIVEARTTYLQRFCMIIQMFCECFSSLATYIYWVITVSEVYQIEDNF